MSVNTGRIFQRYLCGIVILVLLLISSKVFAQKEITIENVDSLTLEYFDNGQWKKLIRAGEKALDIGIESYLLRMRLGTAYFELENYFDAIPHFEKAVSTGYSDGVVKQKLYESYIYAGREEDANVVLYEMTENRRSKLRPLVNNFINDASFDIGSSFSNDHTNNGSLDLDGQDNAYGEQTINRGQFFFDVGIGQLPIRWFKINYAFTYVNRDLQKQIMFNNEKILDDYKQKQGRLFNEFRFVPVNSLMISPSGHYINSEETVIGASFDSVSYANKLHGFGKDSIRYYYTLKDTAIKKDDFILSLSVSKWISVFNPGISGSFSYLNGTHQSQIGLSIKVYPLSNPYLSIFSNAVIHNQNSVSNLIFTQTAEGRITENLWLEGFATFGKISNYNEQNGRIVYNDPDMTKLSYGAMLRYVFPFNMTAKLIYSGQSREKKMITDAISGYQNNLPVYTRQTTTAEYNFNSIALGLKYDF